VNLATFGAILSFGIDLETRAAKFYESAQPLHDHFAILASAARKNQKQLERLRRENVAEMILEPITDFNSDDYTPDFTPAADSSPASVVAQAAEIQATFQRFYETAAVKLPIKEVSRKLNKMARQYEQNREALATLAID
jgi:rubrerythrin